jgi:multidrug resistance efflux pump
MSDWRWLKPFAAGDDDLARELRHAAEKSLERDPGRWSSKHVDETPSHTPHTPSGADPYTTEYDRRHAGRKNQGGRGEHREWSQKEYDAAKRDYEAQRRGEPGLWRQLLRRDQQDTGQDWEAANRAARETVRQARLEREQAQRELRDAERQARDDYRQGRPPPPFRSW